MSAHCHHHSNDGHDHGAPTSADPRYRRILWVALIVNAAMFLLEIGAGLQSGSASLLADAIDFLGDAANYALSLWVLAMALAWRARAALVKGASMLVFGLVVVGRVAWGAWQGIAPEPLTMGSVGLLALAANLGVAVLLYAYREGDANMRSVWLCTRNDVLGNLAVMGAALGVFGTGTAWPDLAVAAVMAWLAITGGWSVIRQARQELAGGAARPQPQGH
ncbi:cation transporter [Acidovorax sp. sif1233]|jgi:Co/Zn/Cd efflux system component|uniref:cation transporter n=1 Tax=unclassified Acidovorax TaxID=2684926 RepID=UPI001C43FF1B|nr:MULTISPECIES: cation transporter [unclassified Acidovorax]MBV7427193.1 cation transporter [Acidovorax sp. sif0732]MBV7448317.1 cation transporter [Acidovorax sp. sif0715]MBV7454158.1 cation transporter [Acidovorax sp. sif1233]